MGKAKTIVPVFGVFLAYYLYNSSASKKLESPVVETLSGSVKGITSLSRDGREFYEYLGIPYAQPPQGILRFESPQPVEKWEGIRDANSYGSVCLQADLQMKKIIGKEDCLFLNVFVPKMSNRNEFMPTMVWLHGGLFFMGSSNMFRPEYFMDHDVVLVTINYRLGSVGFLNTGDEVVRGNMGLKDQNMALKWIQSNIKRFGGDPKQVTIFGHSAGGSSVNHHIVSPLSKGLFKKAIAQSGTSVAPWAVRKDQVEQALRFSKLVGCPTHDSESMVDCLKATDGIKLVEADYNEMLNDLRDPIVFFIPSPEHVNDENTFLPESPLELLRSGNFNKVPLLTGITSSEGLILSIPLLRDSRLREIEENFNQCISNLLCLRGNVNLKGLQEIKHFYFGNERIDSIDKFQNWTNLLSVAHFEEPAKLCIEMHSTHAPVYAYYYKYRAEFALANLMFATPGKYPVILEMMYYFISRWFNRRFFRIEPVHYGISHADELPLLFSLGFVLDIKSSDKEYEMSKALVKSWVDFASDSKTEPLQFKGLSWPPANGNNQPGKPLQYMVIDVNPHLIDQPSPERLNFWRNLKL